MANKAKAASNSNSRFVIFDGDEALKPPPPIKWVIEGLISEGSVTVIYGEAGTKKTYVVLDAAVSLAKGENWLNFKTVKGAVLIVDEESGQGRLLRRLHSTYRGHDVRRGECDIKCVSLSGLKLLDGKERSELLALVVKTKAKLLIIDALIDTLIDGDENNSSDMQTVFQGLRHIAEITHCAVVVIHHANRSGGFRGSSAMPGAVDLVLEVESKRDSPNIDFRSTKTRDIEDVKFAAIANFSSDGKFNLSPSTPKEKGENLSKSETYVLRFMRQQPSHRATIDTIAASADTCTPTAARKAVYALANKGKMRRSNAGARGVSAEYQLFDPDGDWQSTIQVSGKLDLAALIQNKGAKASLAM